MAVRKSDRLKWWQKRRARKLVALRATVAPESCAREDNAGSARLYGDMDMHDEARAIHAAARRRR